MNFLAMTNVNIKPVAIFTRTPFVERCMRIIKTKRKINKDE